ncbi:hypothetical protein IAQ61_003554 [Plenodomus lingam]|uniref:uncharacterized protein n=1 Tax=Leptosphaeria maculans TaxID=5022 RepID=UPI00331F765D|nr:hypothetical protein IAQ61_003554 [Plenodomus lingam]
MAVGSQKVSEGPGSVVGGEGRGTRKLFAGSAASGCQHALCKASDCDSQHRDQKRLEGGVVQWMCMAWLPVTGQA